MKKKYKIEFTYTTEKEPFNVYEVEYEKESDKQSLLENNIHELITKNGATNIVVREICIYKVL